LAISLRDLGSLAAPGLLEPFLQAVREVDPALPAGRGEDHLDDVRQAVLAEEHVLGTAQADAARPKAVGTLAVARDVRRSRIPSRRVSSAHFSSFSNFW